MTTHTLVIETHGICTHFTHGVVSGVPYRVVLPIATQIGAHTLSLPDQDPVVYYLIPHFPQLQVVHTSHDLTIPGVLWHGDVLIGARLQVINCIDEAIVLLDDGPPNLTSYYPDYSVSDDVVVNGRAACYLDIYGGLVSYVPPPAKPIGGAGYVQIEMKTDGLPELLVTPLARSSASILPVHRIRLPESDTPGKPITLNVNNLEPKYERPVDEGLGAFDFMLHYLTASGGIPEQIVSPTPGMPTPPPEVSPDGVATALRELADILAAADPRTTEGRVLRPYDDLTESCSPSQYP